MARELELTLPWSQAERSLTKDMLMYPIFITDDPDAEVEIPSLPGQKRSIVAFRLGFDRSADVV